MYKYQIRSMSKMPIYDIEFTDNHAEFKGYS